jgi:hypothetical protein
MRTKCSVIWIALQRSCSLEYDMPAPPVDRQAYTIAGFCQTYSVGRTLANELMAAEAFDVRRVGRRVLIDAVSADAWYQSLPRRTAA